jgi:hypothetical protein
LLPADRKTECADGRNRAHLEPLTARVEVARLEPIHK